MFQIIVTKKKEGISALFQLKSKLHHRSAHDLPVGGDYVHS